MTLPNIWKNKKCSKPPNRYVYSMIFYAIPMIFHLSQWYFHSNHLVTIKMSIKITNTFHSTTIFPYVSICSWYFPIKSPLKSPIHSMKPPFSPFSHHLVTIKITIKKSHDLPIIVFRSPRRWLEAQVGLRWIVRRGEASKEGPGYHTMINDVLYRLIYNV